VAWNRGFFVVALVASLVVSLGLTLLGWLVFDLPLFALFLFLPFLPILFRGRAPPAARKRCPRCGWSTDLGELNYCPRDGEPLGA